MSQFIWKTTLAIFACYFLLPTTSLSSTCLNLDGIDNNCFYVEGLCIPWDSVVAIDCIKFPAYNEYVLDEVLLFSNTFSDDEINHILHKYNLGLERVDKIESINKVMLYTKTKGIDARIKVAEIRRRDPQYEVQTNNYYQIDNAEPAEQLSFRSVQLDDYPFGMTGVSRLRAETEGQNIKICMIDTPIDISHSILLPDYIEMRNNVVGSVADYQMRHGTAVASILVGQSHKVGVAPKAKLYALGSFASNPNGLARSTTHLIIDNLEYCIKNKADIINLSFAGPPDPIVERVIKGLLNRGILVVAAAGNHGANAPPAYPAAIPGVIAVTAVDAFRNLFSEANRGHYIDYAAPGVDILAAAPDNRFSKYTGTSMATAHVSGLLALLLSQFGPLDHKRLSSTTIDLGEKGRDPLYGYGLINP